MGVSPETATTIPAQIQHPAPNPATNEKSGNLQFQTQKLVCGQLEVAFSSDTGLVRENNEDSVTAFLGIIPHTENTRELQFGYLALADGMGGHESGEVASNMAVRISIQEVLSEFYLPLVGNKPSNQTGEAPTEILTRIMEKVNQEIIKAGTSSTRSMGTTLTSVTLVGTMAYIGHIGDSRLYGLEKVNRQLRQLTQDHSLVARMVEAGLITPQEAADSPQRGVLYKSLGQRQGIVADVDFIRISEFSHLLLCSDGLWEMVADDMIAQIMVEKNSPVEICRHLVQAAIDAGGFDNVSVLVIRF